MGLNRSLRMVLGLRFEQQCEYCIQQQQVAKCGRVFGHDEVTVYCVMSGVWSELDR